MTVVKINAITVREGSGDELARRFAKRAGAVDDAEGFEGFELLQPNDSRDVWLVLTRWRDEESFNAWVSSPAFAHGHRAAGRSSLGTGAPSRRPTPGSGETDPPPTVSVSTLSPGPIDIVGSLRASVTNAEVPADPVPLHRRAIEYGLSRSVEELVDRRPAP